jgi:hypothetical protein
MLKQTRGIELLVIYSNYKDKNGNPAMSGQGEHADLYPPMWSGGS